MSIYEELLDNAYQENASVIEQYDFSDTRLKGLYCDDTIALDKNIQTKSDKACILAEELGHHHTTVGNILDQQEVQNRKQELHARMWAYNRLIGLYGIISCYKDGCQSLHDMAEHLEVTEEFLQEALDSYKSKYGRYIKLDNYVVYFEPYLCVAEII